MDHHCPWLGNCIGFYNRKVFMLSVIYAWTSIAIGIGINIERLIHYKALMNVTQIVTFVLPMGFIVVMFGLISFFLK
jgi:DHHC palmitoyltransferase